MSVKKDLHTMSIPTVVEMMNIESLSPKGLCMILTRISIDNNNKTLPKLPTEIIK
jgi:hypothetical protein